MYKVMYCRCGGWFDFEDVYGSGNPKVFKNRLDAEKLLIERSKIFETMYKVVKV